MNQSQGNVTRENSGIANLPPSDRHRVLAAQRRRVALDILRERAPPVDLEDLAAMIAAREVYGDGPDEETVEQVAITLHHIHLPMMDELGVIDYDPEATLVESSPRRPEP